MLEIDAFQVPKTSFGAQRENVSTDAVSGCHEVPAVEFPEGI